MEESVAKTLINNISSFRPLSSGHAAKVELVKRYCRNIDEILDLLKIFLDEVASKISPDEKLNKVLEELNATINEAVELVGSWSHMMSKFYFVTQVESIITKMQSYLVELCNLLNSLVLRPEVNSISTYMKKLKHIHSEKISVVIREASRDLAGEVMPKPEILAKISDSLSLCTNQEMLMEAVALDKIKMKSSNSEYSVELDDINGIVELVSYMLDKHVEEKQLHTINGVPVPADFCCPLSLELMSDPVIVASGQTYERVFIRKWLDLGYSVCPKTRQTLGHTNLIPNYTVKQLIENWCEIHGIMLPDPVKLLNLSFRASLGLIYESASDEAPLSDSSPRSNKSRSPEQNHSVYVSHQKIPCSSNESHQDNLIHENSKPDDQIYKAPSLEDSNGSESDLSRLSLASSEAKGKSQCNERLVPNALKQLKKDTCQISDVGRHLQSNSSSDPGTSSASSSTNLELLGEDNVGAQVSSDSDAPEVPPEGPVANSSHVGSDFAPRLGGVSSRSQSIWRRPSDRIGPRIILSPSMDSRPDISGIETKVRKLIENLKSDRVELQREATGELHLLSRQSMENRIVIANCGAVAFLVSLLHSADPKTQENAVTVLLNLSLNDNNKIAIANAEAIEPLVHVLQTGNPEAKANSAATLFSLSVIEDNKVRIGRSGAIKPLVELLGHGTPQGKKDSATALFNLSIFHENKARIVQAGAVKHLVELMDPATGMVDQAVSVLGNLATLQEGRNAIAQAGGIPVLVEVVELGSARGKENAAAALLHLCTNSNRLCSLVLQEGAVPPLVSLSQSGTPRAREKAQVLLSYFRSQRLGKSSRG